METQFYYNNGLMNLTTLFRRRIIVEVESLDFINKVQASLSDPFLNLLLWVWSVDWVVVYLRFILLESPLFCKYISYSASFAADATAAGAAAARAGFVRLSSIFTIVSWSVANPSNCLSVLSIMDWILLLLVALDKGQDHRLDSRTQFRTTERPSTTWQCPTCWVDTGSESVRGSWCASCWLATGAPAGKNNDVIIINTSDENV